MLMNLITFAKGIQTRIKNDYKAVDNISHNVREVPDADGAHVQSSRAHAHVLQAICERDVEVGRNERTCKRNKGVQGLSCGFEGYFSSSTISISK